MANPALGQFTTMQREEQVIQFLKTNSKNLYPTLSSPAFFNGRKWQDIFSLLGGALVQLSNQELSRQIQDAMDKLDFGFIAFIRQQNFPLSKCGDQIGEIVNKIIQKPEARKEFASCLTALQYNYVNRYIEQVFIRKEYIHFELWKVQRLKMGKEEIKNLINVTLLLKASMYLLMTSNDTFDIDQSSPIIQKPFAEKSIQTLSNQFKLLPEEVHKSAVDSNLSFIEDPDMETTSRLAAIFAARCRNYRHITKVDRGADTPDKSWFSIARKNYKYYGFDIKMLDELYRIAAEKGW